VTHFEGIIHHHERTLVAAIDDLTAAVTANTDAVSALIAAYQTASTGETPDTAIETQVAALEASTAAATAALPAATPPPAPAPVATPGPGQAA